MMRVYAKPVFVRVRSIDLVLAAIRRTWVRYACRQCSGCHGCR